MALVWKLDQPQYGPDGLVSLYRGDDWRLSGKVIDLINGYEKPVDTSPFSVTGYFLGVTGNALPFPGVTGACGALSVAVPAASSPLMSETNGEGAYVVVTDVNTGLQQTIPTLDQSVAILTRGPAF